MEMAVVVLTKSLYATATIFPFVEYVDEKQSVNETYGFEGVVPSGPPV